MNSTKSSQELNGQQSVTLPFRGLYTGVRGKGRGILGFPSDGCQSRVTRLQRPAYNIQLRAHADAVGQVVRHSKFLPLRLHGPGGGGRLRSDTRRLCITLAAECLRVLG